MIGLEKALGPIYHWLRYLTARYAWLARVVSPIYSWATYLTTRHKSREELHQYWIHPWDGTNLPENYLKHGERSTFLLEIVDRCAEAGGTILEIGCNVGRNLNHLFIAGYTKLAAVEISKDTIDLMKQAYPEMARQVKIYNNPIEDVIVNFQDDAFDVVFTMAVLMHIHTDSEFIFSEMSRITKKYLITIEEERCMSWRHFPRNYKNIFESLGMKQVYEFNCRKEARGLGSSYWARVFAKCSINNYENNKNQ
ncbi:MAG: class I SAM-dependent methyltransferase [Dehalococcoidia bacterium]|nr:class I SAM-dependent methyltransferase [Dehalococcoidia bacterium]